MLARQRGQLARGHVLRGHDRLGVAQRLRREPVLAVVHGRALDEIGLVLLDFEVVDGTGVLEHARVLDPPLAVGAVGGGLEEVELGSDAGGGHEEVRRPRPARRPRGDQELVFGRGADLGPAAQGQDHERPAIVVAEHALDGARAAAMGDHVDARPHRHRVVARLEHGLAAREEGIDRARAGGGRDLGPGDEAVAAVVVAPEHPEGEGAGAGQGVEERLLLHGIHVHRAHVAERHLQGAAFVEAHPADAVAPGRDQAAVAAGEAPHTAFGQLLVQLPLARAAGEEVFERGRRGGHETSLRL